MTLDGRPLIFISNDDGYDAKGINELITALRHIANIIVVAPDGPRSGSASAITSDVPLRCCLLRQEYGLRIYKCNGTPADCVKLGLNSFVPRRPDIVIGGINHGDNSSVNVHYSGTMGVVKEGCLKGIPSIGFSICSHNPEADFSYCMPWVVKVVEKVLYKGLPQGICLNVNFPYVKELKGIKVCRQTVGDWAEEFVKRPHPRGGDYYWLVGEYNNHEPEATDTDHWALDNGYAAITPTQIDMTAYSVMDKIRNWNL